jgi:peptidoglycan/xylan/chitin deacetylase (PgdA/CDA1 family)
VNCPARNLASLLVTTSLSLLLSACGGPSTENTVAQQQPTPTTSTPSAVPSTAAPTGTPSAAPPTGPPPKEGTLAWYIYELPHFNAPPPPAAVPPLPASGPAKQINQVFVGGQKVAFITIDDGWEKDPDIVELLRAAHIPFTMFLTTNAIKSNPAFFTTLESLGGVIEDHTVTHPKLSQESYTQQRHEICDNRATLTKLYGRAPILMRAPYGLSNADTLKAAASCGIRANLRWNEYAVTGSVTYQRPGGIHPGDMVLMHFDKYLKANLLATLQAFHRDGITPALLEDYLVTPPTSA